MLTGLTRSDLFTNTPPVHNVLEQVARARGGVGPPPGITALDPPGAPAALGDARGVPWVGLGLSR